MSAIPPGDLSSEGLVNELLNVLIALVEIRQGPLNEAARQDVRLTALKMVLDPLSDQELRHIRAQLLNVPVCRETENSAIALFDGILAWREIFPSRPRE